MVTISNKSHHPILYLSPMHIAERVIKGFQITDPELTMRQREKKYEDNMKEEKKKLSRYIFEVMKKLNPDGPHLPLWVSRKYPCRAKVARVMPSR